MRIAAALRASTQYPAILRILSSPFADGRGEKVAKNARDVKAQQFTRGGGFTPTGFRPWEPTREFGTRPATVPPLGGSGSGLLAAWRGGPGGSLSISPRRVVLAVDLIYAFVHEMGARIAITAKMRGFLRHRFGVNLSPSKTTIFIPARPGNDASAPEFIEAGRSVLLEAIIAAEAA